MPDHARRPSIRLAVDRASAGLLPDDRHLADALATRGVQAHAMVWGGPVPAGDLVLIRSTWDYVDRPSEFVRWIDDLAASGCVVLNPPAVLRWNVHKRYLVELAHAGVAVVPTELVERGDATGLDEIRARRGWDDVVVKPAIGGSARLTVHRLRHGAEPTARHLADLVAAEDALVQPFVGSIVERGELAVLVVDGHPVAAMAKRAAVGEWRVQSDFGGTAERVELTPELAEVAERALTAAPGPVAYARVDVVWLDDRWQLMELELVEPEMFFAIAPDVTDGLADALTRHAVRATGLRH